MKIFKIYLPPVPFGSSSEHARAAVKKLVATIPKTGLRLAEIRWLFLRSSFRNLDGRFDQTHNLRHRWRRQSEVHFFDALLQKD